MTVIRVAENLLNHAELRSELEAHGLMLSLSETVPYLRLRGEDLTLALASGELILDWESELRLLRAQKLGGKSDLFAKALRPSGGERVGTVLDLTCGTGRDTLHLYSLGLTVYALERDPYLFALQLVQAKKIGEKAPRIIWNEAGKYLTECEHFDVIFYDPMYEDTETAKKRKAAPKKEIQLFYDYFQSSKSDEKDDDYSEGEILRLARLKARRRVVVKRSRKAPAILAPIPYSYEGKSTRYDGYPPLS